MFLFLVAYVLFFAASIALGQTAPADAAASLMPDCLDIHEVAMTWPLFGKILGIGGSIAMALHPFSNWIMRASLALAAAPTPAAQVGSKVLWTLGVIAAKPCWGTPAVLQGVYAGTVTPPTKAGPNVVVPPAEPPKAA